MGEFFGSLYCFLFEDFFGYNLADYLWGGELYTQSQGNSYVLIGLTMLGISLAMALLFYYVINHPKLNNWWGWLIFMVGNAVINFFTGWLMLQSDYNEGKMVIKDELTDAEHPLSIFTQDLLNFGISNALLSILAFFIFSMILKWWSNNCKHAPF